LQDGRRTDRAAELWQLQATVKCLATDKLYVPKERFDSR